MHTELIAAYVKEMYDFPDHTRICCEHLHERKSVSIVSLSDDFEYACTLCLDSQVAVLLLQQLLLQQLVAVLLLHVEFSDLAVTPPCKSETGQSSAITTTN